MSLYKTVILNLIEERPQMHERLRRNRIMLATINQLATELRERHLAIKERLMQTNPERDQTQTIVEAMELAVKELTQDLPSESPLPADELLSTVETMNFAPHLPNG